MLIAEGDVDRAIGALVGLACGDAVGTTVEFRAPGSFEALHDMVGGGPFRLNPGEWTDDTSMALCLAESILDTGRMALGDQLRRYVMWRAKGYLSSNGRCFDVGNTVGHQLSRFEATGQPIDPHPNEESAANGSLMRLAPVPIRWHADVAEAAERSGESSRTTHAATRPVDACRVLGSMTAALITGWSAERVLAPDFWSWGRLHSEIDAVARGSWRTREPPVIEGTGYCVDALEAALWAVAGASDFRDAILRAANLGDDADTTAAIAGQLAGARWGRSGIPSDWLERLVAVDRIESLAVRLYDAGGDGAARPWPFDESVHAWWADSGRTLAGEYPGALDETTAARKVALLVDAGVRTFVDLTEAGELRPYGHLVDSAASDRELDLRHRRLPITDVDVTTDERYREILDTIGDGQRRGVVYVHCWGGVGRTGTVVGCLLIEAGASYDQAIAALVDLRSGTHKSSRPSPETAAQRDVIRRWPSGRPT